VFLFIKQKQHLSSHSEIRLYQNLVNRLADSGQKLHVYIFACHFTMFNGTNCVIKHYYRSMGKKQLPLCKFSVRITIRIVQAKIQTGRFQTR